MTVTTASVKFVPFKNRYLGKVRDQATGPISYSNSKLMKNKNKTIEDKLPNLEVTVGAPKKGSTSVNLAGKVISLNLKVESLFGIGPIWLTPTNYWCKIPDTLTVQEFDVIRTALQSGMLVLGKKYIPPIDKASNTPEEYWIALKEKDFNHKDTKAKFLRLLRTGQDGGWTTIEILQFCLNQEEKTRSRRDVVRILRDAITKYDGPLELYEPPDEKEGIRKIIINKDGSMVKVLNNETVKYVTQDQDADHVPGTRPSSDVLNELLK